VRDLLFPSSPALTGSLRAAARAAARAFVQECRAVSRMYESAAPDQREFVAGEVACVLHLAPVTADKRVLTALAVMAQPRLVAALEHGRLGVPHALAVLSEIDHLTPAHASAVLDDVLGESVLDDEEGEDEPALDLTPGELRGAVKRAAITVDPDTARRRHERAKQTAGVHGRPCQDGMAQIVVDCTATEMARALAAVKGRAAAMTFDERGLTQGQKEVAAFLHALGCDRIRVQAVLECPVDRAVDLHALSGAAVWTVDVRLPVAVALGLSDHPAVLAGYGPIGADEARALLPSADLVRACVDATTGEVLAVDPPVRLRTWGNVADGSPPVYGHGEPTTAGTAGVRGCRRTPDDIDGSPGTPRPPHNPHPHYPHHPPHPHHPHDEHRSRARALRRALVGMATGVTAVPDLRTDGYVPSEALGRLVDLRDVTSVFPGDSTPARRTERDHRLPYPLGATDERNLQNLSKHWHRAKHAGWETRLLPDGTVRWRSPGGGVYHRRPKRTKPPEIPPGTTLPPLA